MLLKFASFTESVVYYQADIHSLSRRSKAEGVQPPDNISKVYLSIVKILGLQDRAVDDSSMLAICIDVEMKCCLPLIHDPSCDQCAILVLLRCSPVHTSAIPIKLDHKTTSMSFNQHSALSYNASRNSAGGPYCGVGYKPHVSPTLTSNSLSSTASLTSEYDTILDTFPLLRPLVPFLIPNSHILPLAPRDLIVSAKDGSQEVD